MELPERPIERQEVVGTSCYVIIRVNVEKTDEDGITVKLSPQVWGPFLNFEEAIRFNDTFNVEGDIVETQTVKHRVHMEKYNPILGE